MKAKIEVNETIIKQALLQYFKNMDATEVTLHATVNQDYGYSGTVIRGEITVDLGDVVAQNNS